MRIPLATDLESRDGTLDQDALVKNGLIEVRGEDRPPRLKKRPGLSSIGTVDADNTTQAMIWWGDAGVLLVLKDDTLYRVNISSFSATSIAVTGTAPSSDLMASFQTPLPRIGAGAARALLSNADTTYGWYVEVTGAGPSWSFVSSTSFRWNSNGVAVPGIVYLDGYMLVMNDVGEIFNSALNTTQTWAATDYVEASSEPSPGAALGKTMNYVIALKEWSVSAFYNAGNPTGSILAGVSNGVFSVGCANGWSLASIGDSLIFVSQERNKGRSVHIMRGLSLSKISTPSVDRVLNGDDLATIHAFAFEFEGNQLYVLL